jgi:hypothetical protein
MNKNKCTIKKNWGKCDDCGTTVIVPSWKFCDACEPAYKKKLARKLLEERNYAMWTHRIHRVLAMVEDEFVTKRQACKRLRINYGLFGHYRRRLNIK